MRDRAVWTDDEARRIAGALRDVLHLSTTVVPASGHPIGFSTISVTLSTRLADEWGLADDLSGLARRASDSPPTPRRTGDASMGAQDLAACRQDVEHADRGQLAQDVQDLLAEVEQLRFALRCTMAVGDPEERRLFARRPVDRVAETPAAAV